MRPLVYCAVAAVCERFVAVVAVEWLLSSVRPLMYCAVAVLCEHLVAVAAFEWLFSTMRANVHTEQQLHNT
jgi:hypothetical protein